MARDLNAFAAGKAIEDALIFYRPIVATDPDAFIPYLAGRTITSVSRMGKQVRLNLDDGGALIAHLKMTGQFMLAPWPAEGQGPPRNCHAAFLLGDPEKALFYRDARKFGRLRALPPGDLAKFLENLRLGPDPFNVSEAEFHRRLTERGARLKAALLDQSVISGLGNIYADECLFLARLHPHLLARELTVEQSSRLLAAALAILEEAIELRGSTVATYQSLGESGSYQARHKVYGRAGLPCAACGAALVKSTVAGRSTVSCPRCQR